MEILAEIFDLKFPDEWENSFGLPIHAPKNFSIHFKTSQLINFISERIWTQDQKITHNPVGSIILTMSVCDEQTFRTWVKSFGDAAQII